MQTTNKMLRIFKNNLTRKKSSIRTLCTKNENVDDSTMNVNQTQKRQDRFQYVPRKVLLNGPNLKDFFQKEHLRNLENLPEKEIIPYLKQNRKYGENRKVYFDVYGCQMNVNDTEIIWSILKSNSFLKTNDINDADVVLIITCAIREGAENKIWNRLSYLNGIRKQRRNREPTRPHMKIGILGCMAERLKEKVYIKS